MKKHWLEFGILQDVRFSKAISLLVLIFFTVSAFGCKKENKEWETIFPPATDSVPKQYDVPFDKVPETKDIVMYEVNLRAFSISGDLAGVVEKLDSIQKLGINVVWLMPIYPDGKVKSVGSPYAVQNYTRVNPDFGTLEDLRLLVKEAHKREMAVILDWVANHTSWDNVWIKNKSWYVQDENGNIIQPPGTNWQDVAELDYSNSDMRKEMIKSMKYWTLEANVDGFRCDYAEGVPIDFWKQAIDTLRKIPSRKIVMFAEAGKKELLSAGFQLVFGWNFYNKLKAVFNDNHAAAELQTVNNADYTDLPANTAILRWISNHDDDAWDNTPLGIFQGINGSMAAFVLAAYMGGVPLIYNGQEVGCPIKLSFFSSPTTKIDWTINPGVKEQYEKLISFRKSSEAVKSGSIEIYNNTDIMAFKRIINTGEVLVIVNVRNSAIDYQLPAALQNSTWKDALSGLTVRLESKLYLEPFEYRIVISDIHSLPQ